MSRPSPRLPSRARRRGVSLVELLVALTVFAVVISITSRTLLSLQSDMVRHRAAVRADEALMSASNAIEFGLRNAGSDPMSTGVPRIEPDPLGTGTFTSLRVTSDFNPADGDVLDPLEDVQFQVVADTLRVRWTAGGTSMAAAYPVTSLRFRYRTRAGAEITNASWVQDSTARIEVTIESNTGRRLDARRSLFLSIVRPTLR